MAGTNITLMQMINHWCGDGGRGSAKAKESSFENGVFDFSTSAVEYTTEKFAESFVNKSWGGDRWAPRKPRGGKRKEPEHELMIKSGALASTFSFKTSHGKVDSAKYDRIRSGFRIEHNSGATEFVKKGRFSIKTSVGAYAAVHNFGNHKTPRRQFMGHMDSIHRHIMTEMIDTYITPRVLPKDIL